MLPKRYSEEEVGTYVLMLNELSHWYRVLQAVLGERLEAQGGWDVGI